MPSILRSLKIDEVSSVDRGAGEGVQIVLMKRAHDSWLAWVAKRGTDDEHDEHADKYLKRTFSADDRKELARTGAALPDGSFPIKTAGDLENAIHAYGRASDKARAKAHIVTRARALGATDKLPDGWVGKLGKAMDFDEASQSAELREYAEDFMCEVRESICALEQSVSSIACDDEIADKQKAYDETFSQFREHMSGLVPEGLEKLLIDGVSKMATKEEEAKRKDDEDAKKAAEKKKTEDDKVLEESKKTIAKLQRENNILKMSEKHRNYMDAADMNEDEKDKFAGKSPAERDDHMDKNPMEKRLPAAVQKALADAATDRAVLKSLQEKDDVATFSKRALAIGLPESHGEVLRKVYAGDKEAIAKHEAFVKGLVEQVRTGKLFAELGSVGKTTPASAAEEMLSKAEEIRKSNPKLSQAQAYARAYQDPVNKDLALRVKADERNSKAAA